MMKVLNRYDVLMKAGEYLKLNLGYLAAVVVLGGIILFHEFGHYLLARLNGIAVVEFSVGFGPRLLSW